MVDPAPRVLSPPSRSRPCPRLPLQNKQIPIPTPSATTGLPSRVLSHQQDSRREQRQQQQQQRDRADQESLSHPRLVLWNGIWTIRDDNPPLYHSRPNTPARPAPPSQTPYYPDHQAGDGPATLAPAAAAQEKKDSAASLLREITLLQKHYSGEVSSLVAMHMRLDAEVRLLRTEIDQLRAGAMNSRKRVRWWCLWLERRKKGR
jgi:hypothetical protein